MIPSPAYVTPLAAFCDAALRTPAAIAVRYGEEVLSYSALEAASHSVAAGLREAGVAPDDVVALSLPRGIPQMIGLLGILQAGATVLPLDAAYPAALLDYMRKDSGAAVTVDAEFVAGALARPTPGAPTAEAPKLCYLLYTSGSTGRPKGVAMTNRAIGNLVAWHQRTLPLPAEARVLQFAPLSFDVSFQEIFSTWGAGGTLVLIEESARRDPRELWRVIADQQISRIFLPYVALQLLAEAAPDQLPKWLSEVITAGEALRITPQIRSLFTRLPACRLHNHYGPTETHVCTAYPLPAEVDAWPLLPPIGAPIDGATALLLGEDGQPANPGILFVGGDCVADGYFGNPTLTAERFVTIGGGRYYRTGDLVRDVGDGLLEFLGRADDQLKVRGFRVEPGEIEAQLSLHPAVRECAVVASDQRLVAFWVGEPVEPAELKAYLSTRVAPQFVPSAFARIEVMPLTPSGKIDRRSLPELPPAEEKAATSPSHLTPREREICEVWAEVLKVPAGQIDRSANFFDLGGTSLTAVAAQQLLGSKLKSELPVTLLFQYPSIQALAKYLESGSTVTLRQQTTDRAMAQRAALARRRIPSASRE